MTRASLPGRSSCRMTPGVSTIAAIMGMKSRSARADRAPLQALASAMRAYGLSLPEAYEDFPWGERVLKVRKKVFVFLGSDERLPEQLGFSVKLPESGQALLSLPFATPTGYGLGKSGWVSVRCQPEQPFPLELIEEWLRESYCAVAPRKLARLVEAETTAS